MQQGGCASHLMDVSSSHPVNQEVAHQAWVTVSCLSGIPQYEMALQACIPAAIMQRLSNRLPQRLYVSLVMQLRNGCVCFQHCHYTTHLAATAVALQ